MQQANGVEPPLTKELRRSAGDRPAITPASALRHRRTAARINHMAQGRCDVASASRALSQCMSSPRPEERMK